MSVVTIPNNMNVIFEHPTIIFDEKIAEIIIEFVNHILYADNEDIKKKPAVEGIFEGTKRYTSVVQKGNLQMDRVAVLIPCYNEAQTIAKVVRDVHKALPEAVVYVYDNNSTDRTVELAKEQGAVVRYERRQGKGNVIRRMFREIDAQCYLMIDGDDTYPLDCAKQMVDQVLLKGADMVVGDRLSSTYFTENKRPFHNFGNSLMRTGINWLFRTNIKDIMTGYRAFSYEFVKTFPVFSKGFEIETEMTIHAVNYNMQVENVVVEYRDRPEGSVSKLNTYSDGARVIRKMLQLYRNYKPLQFFGVICLLLVAAALLLMIPIFGEYLKTGLVPRFPTLIVCGFMVMAGILSFFSGMILEVMGAKDKRDFEYHLMRVSAEKREKCENGYKDEAIYG